MGDKVPTTDRWSQSITAGRRPLPRALSGNSGRGGVWWSSGPPRLCGGVFGFPLTPLRVPLGGLAPLCRLLSLPIFLLLLGFCPRMPGGLSLFLAELGYRCRPDPGLCPVALLIVKSLQQPLRIRCASRLSP